MNGQVNLHKASDVECISCRSVMEARSNKVLLAKNDAFLLCTGCHADVMADM